MAAREPAGLAVRDDPAVVALVNRAARGDSAAWNEIVERHALLVWAICTPVPAEQPRSRGCEAERMAATGRAAREAVLAMLISDSPCSYAEISSTLQIRVGSIGLQRARSLERLRRSDALAGLGDPDVHWAKDEKHA